MPNLAAQNVYIATHAVIKQRPINFTQTTQIMNATQKELRIRSFSQDDLCFSLFLATEINYKIYILFQSYICIKITHIILYFLKVH